jgi:hypothetical protein
MWIKDVLMSCRRATKLLEKKELVPLRPVENMELRIHLFVCKYCSEYQKQNKVINDLMEESNLKHFKGLDPLFKAKMQSLINSRLSKNR